jgi:hypothetical protein
MPRCIDSLGLHGRGSGESSDRVVLESGVADLACEAVDLDDIGEQQKDGSSCLVEQSGPYKCRP